MDILLNVAAAAAIMLAVLSMFSNLGWIMKFRIIAAALAGIIITGLLAWHIAGQLDVNNIVIFPSLANAIVLLVLAFITGFASYFAAWPYGRQIAPVAVPLGLAVWALRSADIASLMQKTADAAAKYQVINQFKWTAVLWLIPIAAGFGGILLAELLSKGKQQIFPENNKKTSKLGGFSNIFTAIAGSVLIALFCIKIFAQDVKFSDLKLGSVVAQPHAGQIAFAVAVSFGIAAFVVKLFLKESYLWTILAAAILPPLCIMFYAKPDTIEYMADNFPAVFFVHPSLAILPIQMVSFGTVGAISGSWLAVVYKIWRTEQAL